MIGQIAGTTTLHENFLYHPLIKHHCIIHQESQCGKTLNLQHVILPVVKCVNKIKARALSRREFENIVKYKIWNMATLYFLMICAGFLEDSC